MNITVEEYTSLNPVTIDLNAELSEALELMQKNQIRHLPVTDDTKIVGIISERDLFANFGKNWSESLKVKSIMSASILTVRVNDNLGDVAYKLSKSKKGSALVIGHDEKLYGMFTTTDALNALVELLIPEAHAKSSLFTEGDL